MAGILDKVEMTRRMCPVIFLVDTSGSMDGAPIGAVNSAIEGVLPELCAMNDENADAEIKTAIMSFSGGADWVTGDKLVSPQNVAWNGMDAMGPTEMGAAFRELDKKLSIETGFMRRASGSVAPVLFLLSDGAPTDDYQSALAKLKENNWYKVAVRVAIGYGDADDNILAEFTGNRETVLHTNSPEDLKKMIRFVSITSSMVASRKVATNAAEEASDDNTAALAEELEAQGGEMTAASADEDW
ncbi:VWA domain-containing protein [Selenomonas sp. AB3002]|uniref:vWA domain-containing protein n=1 Tax=Selenomonas sp. AB3002 TaxID=1392502 RepID=UPI000495A565